MTDEIPVVNEVGKRIEGSIQRSILRRERRRPWIAAVAFAGVFIAIGGTAAFVSVMQSASSVAPPPTDEAVTSSMPVATLDPSQIAELLPVPDGFATVEISAAATDSESRAPGSATRKFATGTDADPTSITVNITDEVGGFADFPSNEGESVRIGDGHGVVESSGDLFIVSWLSHRDVLVQIVARGPVSRAFILAYATETDRAIAAHGS